MRHSIKLPKIQKRIGLLALPDELLLRILSYLDRQDLENMSKVSRRFRNILSDRMFLSPYLEEDCLSLYKALLDLFPKKRNDIRSERITPLILSRLTPNQPLPKIRSTLNELRQAVATVKREEPGQAFTEAYLNTVQYHHCLRKKNNFYLDVKISCGLALMLFIARLMHLFSLLLDGIEPKTFYLFAAVVSIYCIIAPIFSHRQWRIEENRKNNLFLDLLNLGNSKKSLYQSVKPLFFSNGTQKEDESNYFGDSQNAMNVIGN